MIKKLLISLIAASMILASGCEKSDTKSSQKIAPTKIARTKTSSHTIKSSEKEVEIFDLAKDKAAIEFY
ncbi:MAG: hypothetical protein WC269_05860, partial [Candidatus Gracilibacteria bacterium]